MRGIDANALAAVQDGLRALDLLDADPGAEAVRNLVVSPLAGLHDGLDVRPLAAALEARLTRDTTLHALPTKFGFLLDDGTAPSLAGVAADVRFDWSAAHGLFFVGLGGTRRGALRVGTCAAGDLVAVAQRIAKSALDLFAANPDARRMRTLIDRLGATAVAARCATGPVGVAPEPAAATDAVDVVGLRTIGSRATLGLAAPFGRLDHAMLRRAAALAESIGTSEIRLTPWRTLLLPLASPAAVAGPDEDALAGFITEPGDPRLAVAACVGMSGCERGTTPTHADAAHLAVRLGAIDGPLHVSGCEKGCAKPSASPITLVGREGRYDLVRDGRPGDRPLLRGLSLQAAGDAIAAMLVPA